MITPISIRLRGLMVISLLILGIANNAAEASSLRAGVARVNLTPPLEMRAALGGYGARMSKPAVGVHDAIWAKALVLAQDERKFVVVTADILAFPPGFKAAVIERLTTNGWSADQVMLLASHSHTSIDMMALHPGNVFGIPQAGIFQTRIVRAHGRPTGQSHPGCEHRFSVDLGSLDDDHRPGSQS